MFHSGDKFGPYVLLGSGPIGHGAFSEVWLAEATTSLVKIRYAVKILHQSLDIVEIKREANVWAQVSGHINILPIVSAETYDNYHVIVTEYVEGGSLAEWLKSRGGKAPSLQTCAQLFDGILSGLDYLHKRQIVHRDLKPANVLMQGRTPRLTDFGLARVLKQSVETNSSDIIAGTIEYMAPEALNNFRSVRTDLWSAAVLLYKLLTGRLPFRGHDLDLIAAIQDHDPDPLPDYIPTPVSKFLLKALSKIPLQRCQSAGEMLAEFNNAIAPAKLLSDHFAAVNSDWSKVCCDISSERSARSTSRNLQNTVETQTRSLRQDRSKKSFDALYKDLQEAAKEISLAAQTIRENAWRAEAEELRAKAEGLAKKRLLELDRVKSLTAKV